MFAPWRLGILALSLIYIDGCGMEYGDEFISEKTSAVHRICGGSNTVFGIDVSKYQGTIDWTKAKNAGVKFAFARVSDGTNYPDQYFQSNWVGMKNTGIIRGAYQYFRSNLDALAQADLLIQKIQTAGGFQQGDLPCVIDVETTEGESTSTILANMDIWINRVKQSTNRVPIIYTGSYFWDDNVGSNQYSSYPLWIPHYTTNPCPFISDSWSEWKFWQYTDSESVDGISGDVDGDYFNGTLSELQAFAAASIINPIDAGVDSDMGLPEVDTIESDTTSDTTIDTNPPSDSGPSINDTGIIDQRPNMLVGGCTVGNSNTVMPDGVLITLLLIFVALGRRIKKHPQT